MPSSSPSTEPPADERWCLVHEFSDAILARMAMDRLTQDGIPATLGGQHHHGMLGPVMGAYLSLPLHVPESKVVETKALLAEFFADANGPMGAATAEARAAESEGPLETSARSPKRAVAVAVLGIFICGTLGLGHVYVGNAPLGLLIALAGWGSIFTNLQGTARWTAVPMLMVIDAVFAARRAKDPKRPLDALVVVALVSLAVYAAPAVAATLPAMDAWLDKVLPTRERD